MKLGSGFSDPYIVFDGTFSSPRLDHAECVVAAADGTLWCGGEGGQIFRIRGDAIEQVAATAGFILGLALTPDGVLYACDLAARCLWRLDTHSGDLERFGDSVEGQTFLSPNYPLVLADGSVLVSDSGVAHQPRPGLIRFPAGGGSGSVWLPDPINFANGLAMSPDGSSIYVAETWSSRILVVGVDDRGAPTGSVEVYAELPGYLPDGLGFGPDAALYVGCYEPSAILRVPSEGKVELVAHDESAHVLCHPTNVAFRGHELVCSNLGRWHLTGIKVD